MSILQAFKDAAYELIDALSSIEHSNAAIFGLSRPPLSMLPKKPEATGWRYVMNKEPNKADIEEWNKRKALESAH